VGVIDAFVTGSLVRVRVGVRVGVRVRVRVRIRVRVTTRGPRSWA
jgi:hypothetical protein